MTTLTPRQVGLLFWLLCIPSRLFMALVMPSLLLRWILPLVALSFIYLQMTGSRMQSFESGGNTWWNPFRVVHGSIYLIAFIALLFQYETLARSLLVCDVVIAMYLQLYVKPYMLSK